MYYSSEKNASSDSYLFLKCFTGLIFTGGAFITALFYAPLIWSRRVIVFGSLFPIALVAILYFTPVVGKFSLSGNDGLRWNLIFQIVLFATSGLSVLCFVVFDIWSRRDSKSLLLFLWVIGTFIFAAIVNWTINVRAILPLVPAASIILVRMMENGKGAVKLTKLNYIWPLIPCIIISLSVTWADYTLANSSRDAAVYFSQKYSGPNRKMWFMGHWGFQYYMELRDGYPIDQHGSNLNPGDIVVVSVNNTNIFNIDSQSYGLLERGQLVPCRWLATMSSGAGFYSNIWGPLPFSFGPVENEVYFTLLMKRQIVYK